MAIVVPPISVIKRMHNRVAVETGITAQSSSIIDSTTRRVHVDSISGNSYTSSVRKMNDSKQCTILGAGVIGLTTALLLSDYGCKATIITESMPVGTTSAVAPAMWHPYKVEPNETLRRWALRSYQYFKLLSENPQSGVIPTTIYEYYSGDAVEPWYAFAVDGLRKLSDDEINNRVGKQALNDYKSGFEMKSFVIDSSVYLSFLLNQVISRGIEIQVRKVESLDDFIYSDSYVINCTGLGSRELLGDESVYPIRGQVVRVRSNYQSTPECVIDENGRRSVCYVVPRSNDVLLGGTATENDWNTDVDDATTNEIITKAKELIPKLADATFLSAHVGLRPARKEIRCEADELYPWLIHNYGHSGAGYTLSFGCAEEVCTKIGIHVQ
jgi:D-amino-acid oxidase